MHKCKAIGCTSFISDGADFCTDCQDTVITLDIDKATASNQSLADKYPKYYKSVGDLTEIDVYATHQLFNIQDPSGAIHHASKKLLLSGVRTGGKSAYDDIREARDTLSRWLELNKE